MNEQQGKVHVTVFGQECAIRGGADADYVREVAAFVDKRMQESQEANPTKSPLKVAILAALNLADELLICRQEKEALVLRLEDKVREFSDSLNQGLA
jgi:cell division protein ZapA